MSGRYENVDGHRVWTESPTTSVAPEEPASASSDQVALAGALDDFPGFDVYPGYAMHADSVALHFPLTAVPALAELFPTEAEKLRAAALDVEQEAEYQQNRAGVR